VSARRRREDFVNAPPSTVLRWRLILQAALAFIFGVFLAVAWRHRGPLDIVVGFFGLLTAVGGAADAIWGHRYETSLLRKINSESYRAQYAEAELARIRRLRPTNQGPM
jgi:hypothetical protein